MLGCYSDILALLTPTSMSENGCAPRAESPRRSGDTPTPSRKPDPRSRTGASLPCSQAIASVSSGRRTELLEERLVPFEARALEEALIDGAVDGAGRLARVIIDAG